MEKVQLGTCWECKKEKDFLIQFSGLGKWNDCASICLECLISAQWMLLVENKESMKIAPWKDYVGNEIHIGDIIEHPSGENGVVVFVQAVDVLDRWFVDYGDRKSRLCLQIGDKGQAVVSAGKIPASERVLFCDL